MNEYVVAALAGATDPDVAGDDGERVRERLARAGLLAPGGQARRRPDADSPAAARVAAGRGTPLSGVVASGRSRRPPPTRALVKLYADEAGHEQVRALSHLVVARLARVEVPSAI